MISRLAIITVLTFAVNGGLYGDYTPSSSTDTNRLCTTLNTQAAKDEVNNISQLSDDEKEGIFKVRKKLCMRADSAISGVTASSSLANVAKVVRLCPEETCYKKVFPNYATDTTTDAYKAYTYNNFLTAVAKFEHFCGPDYTDSQCKKALGVAFAHFRQEAGGLTAVVENNCCPEWVDGDETSCPSGYNSACGNYQELDASKNSGYPVTSGKLYYGRGAKQLSWNYNYGPFSEAMFNDKQVLLDNPDLLSTSYLAFASAIWFMITPQLPKPSMTDIILGDWTPNSFDEAKGRKLGFGLTTMIINGDIECNKGTETDGSTARQDHYINAATGSYLLGDSDAAPILGTHHGCKDMKPFGDCEKESGHTGGDAWMNGQSKCKLPAAMYWDLNWDKKYCKPVSYRPADVHPVWVKGAAEACCEKCVTDQPTNQPTPLPTAEPTMPPTPAPTGSPTTPFPTVSPTPMPTMYEEGTTRCGSTWTKAQANCDGNGEGKPCHTDGVCPSGQTCYGGLHDCGVQQAHHDKTHRCGATWEDANEHCGRETCDAFQADWECSSHPDWKCWDGLQESCNDVGRRLMDAIDMFD